MYIHAIDVSIYLIHSFPYLFINHHSYIPFFRLKEDDEVDDSNSVVFSVSGRSVRHLCSNCLESLVKELYARLLMQFLDLYIRVWAWVSLILGR